MEVLCSQLLRFSPLVASISFSRTFYGAVESSGRVEVDLRVDFGILDVDYTVRVFTDDQIGSGDEGVATGRSLEKLTPV